MPFPSPKLLVSVRNAEEALAARQGGADIIDIKEPAHGSLGMAEVTTIRHVVDTLTASKSPASNVDGQSGGGVPVSAALGEVVDWRDRPVPAIPLPVAFVKLGLSHLAGATNWRREWLDVRKRFESLSVAPRPKWIAVVYADCNAADSPDPKRIIAAAAETHCAGVLFDTFEKRSGNLLSCLPVDELALHLEAARSCGMMTAVAGRLSSMSISSILDLPVDVIAVRSWACRNQDRNAPICSTAVGRLSSIVHGRMPIDAG